MGRTQEMVNMRHPDIDPDADVATTTREAFDEVWSGKGWTVVEDEEAPPATEASARPAPPVRPNNEEE